MVLSALVCVHAKDGNVAGVRRYLDGDPPELHPNGPGDIHDVDAHGWGLLRLAASCGNETRGVRLMRFLLSRGIDVDQCTRPGSATALTSVCLFHQSTAVELLVSHGANVNNNVMAPPVFMAAGALDLFQRPSAEALWQRYKCVLHLLRAGARLDGTVQSYDGSGNVWVEVETSLEQVFEKAMGEREDLHGGTWRHDGDELRYLELSHELVRAVRAAGGTWRQYVRQYVRVPPKELLRLRSQVARGKARVKVRARAKTPRSIEWLFSPNLPNELCWRVLEYWNPRSGAALFEGLMRGSADARREVAAAAGPAPASP